MDEGKKTKKKTIGNVEMYVESGCICGQMVFCKELISIIFQHSCMWTLSCRKLGMKANKVRQCFPQLLKNRYRIV